MPDGPTGDPRPLVGEPLAIDLLNTVWVDGGQRHDLLSSLDGLSIWLRSPPVAAALGEQTAPATKESLHHLHEARVALRGLITRSPQNSPDSRAALNAVLSRGALRRNLKSVGPTDQVQLDDPSWGPAWTAAASYLDLHATRQRILRCANPQCVLYFYDATKNKSRRWCSMSGCGNRAKAQRHYQHITKRGIART